MLCKVCEKTVPEERISRDRNRKTQYCSYKCAQASGVLRWEKTAFPNGKPLCKSGSTGASHELIVSFTLLKAGYYVFRSASPNAPCDLIALHNGVSYLVEVTTGVNRVNGSISYPKKKDTYCYDWLAVVMHSGEIHWYDKEGFVMDEPSIKKVK